MSKQLPLHSVKRQRTDDSADVVRSDLWFSDGNVVLQAESTQFRVHKSILSRHSRVFTDMFLVGSDLPDLDEVVEGCSVVPLYDSAEDVEHLLKAIYDPIQGFKKKISIATTAAFLRLGKKYDLPEFYSQAVGWLTEQFPSTLTGWDDRELGLINFDNCDGAILDLLWIAREADVLPVLPQVFCCVGENLSLDSLWEGLIDNDASHRAQGLCFADQVTCIRGYERLCKVSSEIIANWARDPDIWRAPRCTGGSTCQLAVYKAAVDILHDPHVQGSFELMSQLCDEERAEGLCLPCMTMLEALWEAWREQIWSDLPSYYGLPPWEELLAQGDR